MNRRTFIISACIGFAGCSEVSPTIESSSSSKSTVETISEKKSPPCNDRKQEKRDHTTIEFDNWSRDQNNPVLTTGPRSSWDENKLAGPKYYNTEKEHLLIFSGQSSDGTDRIGLARSLDFVNWRKDRNNPVLNVGAASSWDADSVDSPTIIKEDDTYHMLYRGVGRGKSQIGHATSSDLSNWNKNQNNPVLSLGNSSNEHVSGYGSPFLWKDGDTYHCVYQVLHSSGQNQIYHAKNSNFVEWTMDLENPVLCPGSQGAWDSKGIGWPSIRYIDDTYYMFYNGFPADVIGLATSQNPNGKWKKVEDNPIFRTGSRLAWDGNYVRGPDTIVTKDSIILLYHANEGTLPADQHIGIATSGIPEVETSVNYQ